jgi:hypothetical protein
MHRTAFGYLSERWGPATTTQIIHSGAGNDITLGPSLPTVSAARRAFSLAFCIT